MTGSSEAVTGLPRLHLVTDGALLRGPGFLEGAAGALEAGGSRVALHLRGPGVTGAELWRLAEECVRLASRSGAWVLVNDRVDVALACGAHGVQLGHASVPVVAARRLLGPQRVIGSSVHGVEEGREAVLNGADFLLAGTLFQSPSHPVGPVAGLEWLSDLRDLGVPIIGIGGIDPSRSADVCAAGGYGVAVISGVWRAGDPAVAVKEYLSVLE